MHVRVAGMVHACVTECLRKTEDDLRFHAAHTTPAGHTRTLLLSPPPIVKTERNVEIADVHVSRDPNPVFVLTR